MPQRSRPPHAGFAELLAWEARALTRLALPLPLHLLQPCYRKVELMQLSLRRPNGSDSPEGQSAHNPRQRGRGAEERRQQFGRPERDTGRRQNEGKGRTTKRGRKADQRPACSITSPRL
eukprot:359258-Chlamydomonas_euryale.AAC.21